jgi:LytR cell envelope-related transcriptional attenuator
VRKNGAMADRGTQTGGSSGGRGRGLPLGAGSQTVKGGLLVGAAVVLGILLLQVVDPGKAGPVAGRQPTATTSTTSTTSPHTRKTTPTTKTTLVKTPAKLRLLVLNAGAPAGSAGTVSTTLHSHGYTNQGTPGNDPNHRVGKAVLCRAGLTREGATLAVLLGTGTTKGTISNPAPPGSTGYDCVVLVGTG